MIYFHALPACGGYWSAVVVRWFGGYYNVEVESVTLAGGSGDILNLLRLNFSFIRPNVRMKMSNRQ